MKKLFSKKLLPLFLTVVMLVTSLSLGGLTATALYPSATPSGDGNYFSHHTVLGRPGTNSTKWTFTRGTVEQFGTVNFSSAPAGALLTFDFDTTMTTENPNPDAYGDQDTFAFYIDFHYLDWQQWGVSDPLYNLKPEPCYADGKVMRQYTSDYYNPGELHTGVKNDMIAEPGTWIFSVPLGSKGTIAIPLYQDRRHPILVDENGVPILNEKGWQQVDETKYIEGDVAGYQELNRVRSLRIRPERWLRYPEDVEAENKGEEVSAHDSETVCVINNIGYSIPTTTPPTGYSKGTQNGNFFIMKYPGGVSDVTGGDYPTPNFWSEAVTRNAPEGSRLAIYFDTTSIKTLKTKAEAQARADEVTALYPGGNFTEVVDGNCFSTYNLFVWRESSGNGDTKPTGWVNISKLIGGTEKISTNANGQQYTEWSNWYPNVVTVFTREENGEEVTRVCKGAPVGRPRSEGNGKNYCFNYNSPEVNSWELAASDWQFTLPSASRGWIIFEFTDPTEIRNLNGFTLNSPTGYGNNSAYKDVYLGNAGIVPADAVVSATEDVYVEQFRTAENATIDNYYGVRLENYGKDEQGIPVKQVKAGSLKVYDLNGNVIGVPYRYGYQSMSGSNYNNTTQFEMMVDQSKKNYPSRLPTDPQDVIVKAEYVDTATLQTPNFAYIGWQRNTTSGGLRSVYRFNLTREGWYHWAIDYYTYFQGKKQKVDAFGILMCTEKVYNRIGGANGMVTTCTDASLYNTDFYDKVRRWDACADYEDTSLAMVGLNTATRQGAGIYTRGYIVVEGVTYYTDIQFCSYDLSKKGTVAAAGSIEH